MANGSSNLVLEMKAKKEDLSRIGVTTMMMMLVLAVCVWATLKGGGVENR